MKVMMAPSINTCCSQGIVRCYYYMMVPREQYIPVVQCSRKKKGNKQALEPGYPPRQADELPVELARPEI